MFRAPEVSVTPCSARAGFGRADVTPEQQVEMSGFAARQGASQGVHDRLEARCMLVLGAGGAGGTRGAGGTCGTGGTFGAEEAPVAVVTLDVIGVDAALTAAIREAVAAAVNEALAAAATAGSASGVLDVAPLPPERVAVAATHTHSGPATLRAARLGQVDPALLDLLVAGARQAAAAAVRDLKPGWFRFGRAEVEGVAVNRRVTGGPVDTELQVLGFWPAAPIAFDEPADRDEPIGVSGPSGLLATFALHPVVLGPDNLLLTRDYVGFVLDDVEVALSASGPGCVPLWATGFAGQVNHGHLATASSGAASERRSFGEASRIGKKLAAAVREAVSQAGTPPRPGEIRCAAATVELEYLPPNRDLRELAAEWRRELAAGSADVGPATLDHFRRAVLPLMAAWADQWAPAWADRTVPATRTIELQGLGIEGVALVFCPGEPFVELGLALKRGLAGAVMPIAYANDAPGYLPTAAAHGEGGYEVDSAYMFYGEPGVFGPGSERVLCAGLDAVAREVLEADDRSV